MESLLRVEDFFNLDSWGPTVVFKFINLNTVLSHGTVLEKGGGARWKIIGMSTPNIKHSETPCGKDYIFMSYRLEHLDGDKTLNKGDLIRIESR